MDEKLLVTLTTDIVSAHVANNIVAVGDVARLVERVHEALSSLGQSVSERDHVKIPVVSIRASIKPDYLVCLECGRRQKMLKRHLRALHGMSPDQYRADYSLPRDYPMVAPNYAAKRRELAEAIGLGRKKAGPAPARAKPRGAPRKRKAPAGGGE